MTGVGFKYGMTSIAAIASVMVTAPAAAQTRSFNVPAQAAEKAIPQLAKQAGVPILASGKVVKGKQTRAVQGEHTVDEALAILLQGTGLKVQRAGNGRGMITIVPASAVGNASGAASGGAEQARGQAVLIGSVRDHKTGAALKGARVEVIETGDTTSTGDLGDFRFARLPTGDVSLRVTYLGFPEQSETVSVVGGLTNRTDIYLGSGATSEIVVYGQVSARAQALNQERTAENSTTVISGDLLGNFNGTTLSDALRRAPGVSFQQDDLTGDGTNINVRGLSPDYNEIKLNGVALPEATGTGRSASLNNFLTDSVSEIKISKTLLASQDSAGTGGLIEIETKSPLDRPRRFFNVSVDGTKRAKGFGEDFAFAATGSLRLGGAEEFGISASFQRRKQDVSNFAYIARGAVGPYLPLGPNGEAASFSDIDPREPFPFFDGADYYIDTVNVVASRYKSDTTNLTLSGEWQVSSGTNLRLDYNRSVRKSDTLSRAYSIGSGQGTYTLRAVPGENGELRYVYGDRRNAITQRLSVGYEEGTKSTTDTVSFRGKSSFGALTLDYRAGYAKGRFASPFNGIASFSATIPANAAIIAPEAINPVTGTVITYFGPRTGNGFPVPLFTAAGLQTVANNPVSRLVNLSVNDDLRGGSTNWNGAFDAKYEFAGSILKYVEAGFDYKRSRFGNTPSGTTAYPAVPDPVTGLPTIANFPFDYEIAPFARVGGAGSLYRLATEQSLLGLYNNLDDLVDGGILRAVDIPIDPLLADQYTREANLAAYIQTRADIGKLEIIGGVRVERVRAEAGFANSVAINDENYVLDQDFYNASLRIIEGSDVKTTYLPRILMNFRPSENVVLRAGYYSTVARPQISQITAVRSITYYASPDFGPTGGRPGLFISQGNPALKSARTHNFDFGGEWYDGKVGVIKANIFYKRIDNLLESNAISGFDVLDNVELPDHPVFQNLPDNVFIELTYPVNNPDTAKVWGFELAAERQLTFLPGILSGFGIYANYTYSRSKKTQLFTWSGKPVYDAAGDIVDRVNENYTRTLPFAGSPRHSGTVGITYSRPGFDSSLFYTAQARRFNAAGFFGQDSYNEAASSLDFRAAYTFDAGGHDIRLTVEGLNLLKGRRDPVTQTSTGGVGGNPKYYTTGYFNGGRSVAVGLSATF
jgi:TonB-dependent receptor